MDGSDNPPKATDSNQNELNREDSEISQNSESAKEEVKQPENNAEEAHPTGAKPKIPVRYPSQIPKTYRAPSTAVQRPIIVKPVYSARPAPTRAPPSKPLPSNLPTKTFGKTFIASPKPTPAKLSCQPKKSVVSINSQKNELRPTTSSMRQPPGDYKNARERVAENNRLKLFENLHKSLYEMQSEFMKKLNSMKLSSPEKIKNEYKLVAVVRNGEYKLMIKDEDLAKLPGKIPVESVGDLKRKVKDTMDESVANMLKMMRTCSIKDRDFGLKMEEARNSLEEEKERRLDEINEVIDQMCQNHNDDELNAQIVIMQKEIHDTKLCLLNAEERIKALLCVHRQQKADIEAKLTAQSKKELLKKDEELAKLQCQLSAMEELNEQLKATADELKAKAVESNEDGKELLMQELKTCQKKMEESIEKIFQLENALLNEKEEKLQKVTALQKLDAELEATKLKLEKSEMYQSETQTRVEMLMREVRLQRDALDGLELQKEAIGRQVNKLKGENQKVQEFASKLQKARQHIGQLEQKIVLLQEEKLNVKCENTNTELSKLRQSEAEKKREIEKLKTEMVKCQSSINHLEEQKQRDRQLLEVRSELINSLQNNDISHRSQLEKLFTQMVDKNNAINELNTELETKSEEFRNLFTTLSSKQAELGRQEHMIRLLEESNERSQLLRVKQEEKISRMEDEILQLKSTIAYYQTDIVNNVSPRNGPPSSRGAPSTAAQSPESPDNINQYREDRRRKRKTDISVKKYEA